MHGEMIDIYIGGDHQTDIQGGHEKVEEEEYGGRTRSAIVSGLTSFIFSMAYGGSN